MKKIISIILAVGILSGLLTSCSTEEIEFLGAYEKFSKVSSVSDSGELSMKLSADVPDELIEDMKPFELNSLLNMLSNFKMNWTQDYIRNGSNYEGTAEFITSAPDMSFKNSAYFKSDDKNMKVIAEIPTPFKALLPKENIDAEAVTVDMGEYYEYLNKMSGVNMLNATGVGKLMRDALDFSGNMFTYLNKVGKAIEITDNTIKKENGDFVVTLTDKNVKEILNVICDKYFSDKEFRDETAVFAHQIVDLYKNVYGEELISEMSDAFDEFLNVNENELAAQGAYVKNILNRMSDVQIIGDEGIVITLDMDKNGYPKSISANFNLMIDVNGISIAIGEEAPYPEDDFIFNLQFNSVDNFSNINSIKSIDKPDFSEKSIDLIDWIDAYAYHGSDYTYEPPVIPEKTAAADGSISIYAHNERIEYINKPVMHDGMVYASLCETVAGMYGEVIDAGDGKLSLTVRKNCVFTPDSNIVNCDGYSILLSGNTINVNGAMFVPVRSFFKAVYGSYNVEWNESINSVIVGY